MKGRKRIVTAAALLFALAALAGCGGQGDKGEQAGGTDEGQGSVDYDVDDYVTLGDYKGLDVKYLIPEVSDEDLQDEIESRLEENTEYKEITGRPAQEGDSVNIDYTGTLDGEEFDGGSDTGYDLVLGSGEFIDGFESSLVGKNAGETVTFPVTFPDDYDDGEGEDSLSGKEAEFTVTINSISEVIVPEYDMDFIRKVSDCGTKEEYEKSVRDELYKQSEEESLDTAREDALAAAVGNATVDGYPQELYDEIYEAEVENYRLFTEMTGWEFTDEEILDAAMEEVNETLVVQAIAQEEGIGVSEEEYQAGVKELAEMDGYEDTQEYEKEKGKDALLRQILRGKVVDAIYESAKVEEVTEDEYYDSSDSDSSSSDSSDSDSSDSDSSDSDSGA